MQDRYLFRAKRLDNGQWVQGFICKKKYKSNKFYISCFHDKDDNEQFFAIDPDTICQCTGLKDKNGNLIWENDVVGFWDTYSTENGHAEMDCIGKVVWDDETISFQVTNRLYAESYEVLDECSVIGNIFDNPDLFQQCKEDEKNIELEM